MYLLFFLDCIKKLQDLQGQAIECPLCQKPTLIPSSGIDGLEKNLDVVGIRVKEVEPEKCQLCIHKVNKIPILTLILEVHTLMNVCGVLWRGYSALWRVFSSVEGVQFCGGFSVLWRVFITVVGYHQYRGGYFILQRETTSTVEIILRACFSLHTVLNNPPQNTEQPPPQYLILEGAQYC